MVALTKKKTLPSEVFFLKIGPNLVDGIRRNHCGTSEMQLLESDNKLNMKGDCLTVTQVLWEDLK